MSNRTYALVGRHGDDGGRYLTSQWKQMYAAGWRLHRSGSMVQVWRANDAGIVSYDSVATQRMTDYIVKGNAALQAMDASAAR